MRTFDLPTKHAEGFGWGTLKSWALAISYCSPNWSTDHQFYQTNEKITKTQFLESPQLTSVCDRVRATTITHCNHLAVRESAVTTSDSLTNLTV